VTDNIERIDGEYRRRGREGKDEGHTKDGDKGAYKRTRRNMKTDDADMKSEEYKKSRRS
jgi:hypothetical protein